MSNRLAKTIREFEDAKGKLSERDKSLLSKAGISGKMSVDDVDKVYKKVVVEEGVKERMWARKLFYSPEKEINKLKMVTRRMLEKKIIPSEKFAIRYNSFITKSVADKYGKFTENEDYYYLPNDVAWQLYCGISPVEISFGLLTKAEAHEWIEWMMYGNHRYYHPAQWKLDKEKINIHLGFDIRSDVVFNWIYYQAKKDINKMRNAARFYSTDNTFSRNIIPYAILDEITVEMITAGNKTSFKKVMAKVVDVRGPVEDVEIKEGEKGMFPEFKPEKMGRFNNKYGKTATVKQIMGAEELLREKEWFHNCAYGYKGYYQEGARHCFIMESKEEDKIERSMFEIDVATSKRKYVLQHRGKYNESATVRSSRILGQWCKMMDVDVNF